MGAASTVDARESRNAIWTDDAEEGIAQYSMFVLFMMMVLLHLDI